MAVDQVLPRIAERVLADGGRLLIVAADDALAERIDALLWSWRPTSFLPHGRAGQGDEAMQPVLIAPDCTDAANGARHVVLADGVWRDAAFGFERAFLLFDAATIAGARAAWRLVKASDGVEPHFWRQDAGGRWREGP